MQWLSGTGFTMGRESPLPRAAAAVGPYLSGLRFTGSDDVWKEGLLLLYSGNNYDRTLLLARLGELPFFWIASLVVFYVGKHYFGELTALFATGIFTSIPPVLAHAGLATTDMANTAFLSALLFSILLWIEAPTWTRIAIVGIFLGLAVLSKFSVIVFLPLCLASAAIIRPKKAPMPTAGPRPSVLTTAKMLGAALAIAGVVIWAGYRFSTGTFVTHGIAIRIPAPELLEGLRDLVTHNRSGHPSYLLGKTSNDGFRLYFPVVFALKSPLALLILVVVGIWTTLRQRPANRIGFIMLAFATGIFLGGITSRITIGLRHILPIYVFLSILAGLGAVRLLHTRQAWAGRTLLGVLLLWLAGSSAYAHPDYLAYFNELAGKHPERIVADSDLDWGQDIKRLSTRLHQLGADHVAFTPQVPVCLDQLGFPPRIPNRPEESEPGWNAVSIMQWKIAKLGGGIESQERLWVDGRTPTERVGSTILLFYDPRPRTSAVLSKPVVKSRGSVVVRPDELCPIPQR
jgi:Dolichyl-phosphate-mannose-protein mannosyltransferase